MPDFLPRPARPPGLAWAWCACAVLVFALAADEGLALAAAREDLARQLERARAAATPLRPAAPVAAPRREAVLAARRVAARLGHPWRTVFEDAEAAAAPGVRWLRLEHDAERGDLRLAATAPNRDAVRATLDRLGSTAGWDEVMLLRLEEDARSAVLRFELRARLAVGAGAVPR